MPLDIDSQKDAVTGWLPRNARLFLRRVPGAVVCCVGLSLFPLAATGWGAAEGTTLGDDSASQAMALASKQAPREALRTLQHAAQESPHNVLLLTQLSRAWSDAVDSARDHASGERAAKSAMEAGERAVQAGPRNAKAHVSVAIACGKMTDYVDNSTKLSLSKRIRDEAKRAIALDPRDDEGYYILGRWNYGMASLNPFMKVAARMAYGAMPPASMGEAVSNLERAVALAPRNLDAHKQLAVAYQSTHQHEKALQQWKAVLSLPAADADDEQAKQEARAALRK